MNIGLLTTDSLETLRALGSYVQQHSSHTFFLPQAAKTHQLIGAVAKKTPFNYRLIHIAPANTQDWKQSIQEFVKAVDKLVLFIPPGKRIEKRKAANHTQSYAAFMADTQHIPIERIYPKTNQQAHVSSIPYFRIPYPTFSELPSHWYPNVHPCHTTYWKQDHIYPLLRRLFHLHSQSIEFDQQDSDCIVQQQSRQLRILWAGVPEIAEQLIQGIPPSTSFITALAIPYEHRQHYPTCDTPYVYLNMPQAALDLLVDYRNWWRLPTSRQLPNGSYLYTEADYQNYDRIGKEWEARHMYPAMTRWLSANTQHFKSQVYLADKRTDFIAQDTHGHINIFECKRVPYGNELVTALEQLELYKSLYRELYQIDAKYDIVGTIVLPQQTCTMSLQSLIAEHGAALLELVCDEQAVALLVHRKEASRNSRVIEFIEHQQRRK